MSQRVFCSWTVYVVALSKVWTTDITYVWTLEGWLYVAIVIDLFSRQVAGWSISNSHYDQNLADFVLGRANDSAFRCIGPIFPHKIEQMLSAIKAQVGRKRLHIIEQTFARRWYLTKQAELVVHEI